MGKTESMSSKIRNDTECSLSLWLSSIVLEVSAREIKQEKGIQIGEEKVKMSQTIWFYSSILKRH
jgi:hypothetical protein